MGEVLTPDELTERIAELRGGGVSIAFANGHFDLLHVGHLRYLRAARAEADRLVPGDPSFRPASARSSSPLWSRWIS
jgi:cytidyltransferase-like protein